MPPRTSSKILSLEQVLGHDHKVAITLALIAMLGAIFLKGFKEAIGIAVLLVGVYLLLNLIVIGVGLSEIVLHPEVLPRWKDAIFAAPRVQGNPFLMVGVALLLFPKLALGLSGFETGVAVMPLVKGDATDTKQDPRDASAIRASCCAPPRSS